jgi:hypothetical protein
MVLHPEESEAELRQTLERLKISVDELNTREIIECVATDEAKFQAWQGALTAVIEQARARVVFRRARGESARRKQADDETEAEKNGLHLREMDFIWRSGG